MEQFWDGQVKVLELSKMDKIYGRVVAAVRRPRVCARPKH
jgi:hypothetical protein